MNSRTSRNEPQRELTVGQVAARSGLTVPTIRFYESKGLIGSRRNSGNQRRFPRGVLRRLAVIKVAQRLGVSLDTVGKAIASLPAGRAPTAAEWRSFSLVWKDDLNDRITRLTNLRDRLSGCIGCGCLSLKTCPLRNPQDRLASEGPGSRLLEHRALKR